jgi:3-deoxy-D-manno-octulosonic-acid transferase
VFLVELELWPGFLAAAARRGIPVIVVNGRISERSFRGYARIRRLLPQLDLIHLYCVQNRTYAERLLKLGVPPGRVVVTGNMKFDGVQTRDGMRPDPELAALLGLRTGDRVVVAGSTHGSEERILHETVDAARGRSGLALRLIVAPRHPERTGGVLDAIAAARGSAVTLSQLRSGAASVSDPRTTVVVDTIGELERFYGLADVVFVGGSLVNHGGQNMLEPAALGKPTLFGPHVHNFRADVDLLLAGGGVRMVQDRAELLEQVCEWLSHPEAAAAFGQRALDVIAANQGAAERTVAQVRVALATFRAAAAEGR